MTERYYPCRVVRVVDGDTLVVDVDHGFNLTSRQTDGLAGVNAPELGTPEGRTVKGLVEAWVEDLEEDGPWPFTLIAYSDRDKYGRRVADLSFEIPINTLAEWLLENDYAEPWPKVMV
jgi:endonuclease YncB( thermonuclease family)